MSDQEKERKPLRPEEIKLEDFRVVRSKVEASDEFLHSREKVGNIEMHQDAEHAIGLDQEQVDIRIDLFLRGKNEAGEKLDVQAEFRIDLLFTVEDLERFTSETKNGLTVSGNLVATLAGIAYSTCRGLVSDRLAASPLKGVILPVIDPKLLLEEDGSS